MTDIKERLRQPLMSLDPDRIAADRVVAADRIEELEAALQWYGERAASLGAKNWRDRPEYAEAIFVELSLDRGSRAGRLGCLDEPAQCDHEWIDIRNNVIESGEMCRKCQMVRAGNEATS